MDDELAGEAAACSQYCGHRSEKVLTSARSPWHRGRPLHDKGVEGRQPSLPSALTCPFLPSFLCLPQRQLANYNFDFRSWPVDFHWEEPSSR